MKTILLLLTCLPIAFAGYAAIPPVGGPTPLKRPPVSSVYKPLQQLPPKPLSQLPIWLSTGQTDAPVRDIAAGLNQLPAGKLSNIGSLLPSAGAEPRYVAVGGSLTAGYRNGDLYREAQLTSYPNLIARQMGLSDFRQPLFDLAQGNGSGYKQLVSGGSLPEDCSTDIPQFPQMLSMYPGYPIATQGPTNWAYTVMGNRVAAQTGCPVAVFNAARFATAVKNWDDSKNGGPAYNVYTGALICNQNGVPYTGLKNALNFYGSLFGVRAILWHQGEADNQQSTTSSDYQTRLNNVINQTRANFSTGLSWYIARATYNPEMRPVRNPPLWPDVINGQNSVASSNKYGPATDNLGIPRNGDPNEVHFGGTPLKDLGEAWQVSNLVTANPVVANGSPATIAVALNGGNYTLTAQPPSGFTQIYWVTSSNKLSSNFSTASSITVSGSNNSYRYYARNGTGNVVVSAKVDIPLPSGSARIGVAENLDGDYNGYRLSVTPNPVSEQTIITTRLPKPSRVLLDIVNQQGRVMKIVVDAALDTGSYDYPVDASQLLPGTYVCRLRADDFFLTKKLVKAGK